MKHAFILLVSFCFTLSVFSQVTIGSDNPPESFSILQIDGNGGIRIPQLTTIQRTALSTSDNIKASGLIIYNTDINKLELWNGVRWVTFQNQTINNDIVGENGLTSTLDSITGEIKIELGGILSNTRTIDMNGNKLELETQSGQLKIAGNYNDSLPALDVEGKVRITKPGPLPQLGSSLVIDDEGNLGIETAETIVSLMLFAQSAEEQSYSTISANDNFNGSILGAKTVEWTESDIVSNAVTIAKLEKSSEFVFTQDGQYEFSGYINYQPNAKPSGSYPFAAINVAIQYSQDDGTTWREIALARTIWSAAFERSQTVVVPSAIGQFNKGDRIRMIFFNPFSTEGLPHGQISGWGIKKPTGAKYTKAIKIIAL